MISKLNYSKRSLNYINLFHDFKLSNILTFKNKFLITRHGESIWNKSSNFTGWTDIPLTNHGKQQAIDMTNVMISKTGLIPNLIFSSVLKRSLDTSTIIKQELDKFTNNNINIKTSWRLNERHYGRLEGTSRQDFRDKYG
jgi:2,3-bisphosphoglycerate-dependent phosphoglycerate mutase